MKNIIEDFMTSRQNSGESVNEFFKNIYLRIFEVLFQDRKTALADYTHTGDPKFPERNLTVNFAEAIKKRYPRAICWYEFQLKDGEGANKHLDAVIVVPDEIQPFVLICESKRDFHKKREGVSKDIERIRSYKRHVQKSISNERNYHYFGVILIDGWNTAKKLQRKHKGKTYISVWNSDNISTEFWFDSFSDSKYLYETHCDFGDATVPIHDEIANQYTIKTIMWSIE